MLLDRATLAVCVMVYLSVAAAAAPTVMRAAYVNGTCQKPQFSCISTRTLPTPALADGQVLIKVAASSVNPCDVDAVELGRDSGFACEISPEGIPGSDVAGVVAAVGRGCHRLIVGDAVWTDVLDRGGAIAEYVAVPEIRVGLRPSSLSAVEAGTIPLDGATSLECLQQTGAPWGQANLTVVVTSGSGGTGFLSIQLAKALGATRVVTAATAAGIAFAESLGADLVIDYKKQDIFDALPDNSVDIVFDNHGAKGTADRAMPKIRSGGLYSVLFGNNNGTISRHPKAGVRQLVLKNVNASSYETLDTLRGLFEEGQLRAHVQQAFMIDELGMAYNTSVSGHVLGKLAVTI